MVEKEESVMADESVTDKLKPINYVLYKLDRTLSIIGIIAIAICSIAVLGSAGSKEIVMASAGGLIGYIGGRAGK